MKTQTHPRSLFTRQMEEDALEMRKQGKSYREIADQLGFGYDTCHQGITNALNRLKGRIDGLAEDVRRLELAKLDAYLTKLQPKIDQGDTNAVNSALRCMERKAKLVGLDMPTKSEVRVTAPEEMETLQAQLLERLQQMPSEEPSPEAGG